MKEKGITMSIINNNALEKLEQELDTIHKQIRAVGEKSLLEITNEFFKLNPGITAVYWKQYTPWFNDGDQCVFNVYDLECTNAGNLELFLQNKDKYLGRHPKTWWNDTMSDLSNFWDKDMIKIMKEQGGYDETSCAELKKIFLPPRMNDILLSIFGDHVTVVITREGVKTMECEHE